MHWSVLVPLLGEIQKWRAVFPELEASEFTSISQLSRRC